MLNYLNMYFNPIEFVIFFNPTKIIKIIKTKVCENGYVFWLLFHVPINY